MTSTKKLKTGKVIKFSQQQGDPPSKTLKQVQLCTGNMQFAAKFFSIGTHVLEKEPQA